MSEPDVIPTPSSDGLWLSVSDIARQRNRSRQAISKRVAELEAEGLIETRQGEGGTKLVNLAQFNIAVGETGDAVKESAAETRAENIADAAAPAPAAPAPLRDAQTRKTQYEADLREIELKVKLGEYVPLAEVIEGQQRAAEVIIRVIERKSARAAEIAAAVSKDGEAGARAKLRDIAREERQIIADALNGLVAAAEHAHATDAPLAPAESAEAAELDGAPEIQT